MVGICKIPKSAWLKTQIHNQDVTRLAGKIETMQVQTLAVGIDVIMAGLKDAMRAPTRWPPIAWRGLRGAWPWV